jgi:S1-C subfamily serine protease
MQLSSGLSFDDAEMLLVSVQKPLGLLLEEIEVEAREVEGSEVVESAAMASEPGAGGGGGVVVVEVSDVGSAARAGVAAGDRLLAVNNQDVSDAPLEQVLAHLAAAPRVLNLRFLRGGRT